MPQTRPPQRVDVPKLSKSTTQSAPLKSHSPIPLAPIVLQRGLAKPLTAAPTHILQLQRQYGNRALNRLIQHARAEKVQRESAVGLEGGGVGANLQNQINSARGGGQPLDRAVGD